MSEKIKLKNREGLELSAILEYPINRKPRAFAIFAHCFTCNKNFKAVRNITKGLTDRGFAVIKFDFTGLGESEGDFVDTNFSSNVNDLIDVSNYLSKNHKAPELLVGHSLGGAAVLFAAKFIASIKAVATIGAPSEAKHVQHLFESKIDEIKTSGTADVMIGGRPFKIKDQFLNDLASKKLKDEVPNLKKAVLIMHSPQDETVEIINARELYELAHHPKSFVSLDGADHLLTNKDDSLYAGHIIGMWADRYTNKPAEKNVEKVSVTNYGSYTSFVEARSHELIADEPKDLGGNDLGPTPTELLKASLGACTAITLEMYAKRKKWPVESVKVEVEYSSENQSHFFERKLDIQGSLSSDQKARMLEIANKCPIHKILEKGSQIKTDSV